MESLEALLEVSDIVTLHVPLDSSTKGMISTPQLERMRSDAVLINTCRGTSSNPDEFLQQEQRRLDTNG